MTVPNILTLIRVAMIPVFAVTMGMGWRVAALVLFSVASVTDMLDGYLARRMGQITKFGKFMDPLADKLLVFAAIVFFRAFGACKGVYHQLFADGRGVRRNGNRGGLVG